MNLNSVNLVQVDGGTRVKQNDTASVFAYKLVDEKDTPIEALKGKSARITLATFDGIVYETSATVSDDVTVSFTISKILRPRDYMLEITCEGYVFPSDRSMSIEVVKTSDEYVAEGTLTSVVTTDMLDEKLASLPSKDDVEWNKTLTDGQIAALQQDLNNLDSSIDERAGVVASAKISEFEQSFTITFLQEQITDFSNRLSRVETDITMMNGMKETVDSLSDMYSRMLDYESKVGALEAAKPILESKTANLQDQINSLVERIQVLEAK